jgi:hypothetical protein
MNVSKYMNDDWEIQAAQAFGRDNNGVPEAWLNIGTHTGLQLRTSASVSDSDMQRIAQLVAAAPKMLDALLLAENIINHHPGLKYRMDVFTRDERATITAALEAAREGN